MRANVRRTWRGTSGSLRQTTRIARGQVVIRRPALRHRATCGGQQAAPALVHFPIGRVPVMPPNGLTALANSCPAESSRLTLSTTLSAGATMATYFRPVTLTGLYVRGDRPPLNSATTEAVRGLTSPAYPASCDLPYGIGTKSTAMVRGGPATGTHWWEW